MDGVVQVQVVKQAARCRVPADQCAHVSRTKRKKGHVNVARARWAASVSVRNVGREKDGPAAGGRFLLYDEQQTVLREAPPLFKTASHRIALARICSDWRTFRIKWRCTSPGPSTSSGYLRISECTHACLSTRNARCTSLHFCIGVICWFFDATCEGISAVRAL